MRVTVYHNVARDEGGRRINFNGYRPGQPLVPVFCYDVELLDGGPEMRLVAEEAFEVFNRDPHQLVGRKRDLAARYRAAQLRSLSVGDVVRIGGTALTCEPVGFREVSGDLNEVRVSEPGTHPVSKDDAPAEPGASSPSHGP